MTVKQARRFTNASDLDRWLRWSVNEINDDVEVILCARPWDELIDLTTVPLAFTVDGGNSRARCSWKDVGGPEKLYLSPGCDLPPYPGQLARRYIKLCMTSAGYKENLLIVGDIPEEIDMLRQFAPTIYNPTLLSKGEEYAHIDMIAAYWQILSVCCLDSHYTGDVHDATRGSIEWLHREWLRDTTMPGIKAWRKAICGTFNHAEIAAFRYGERCQEPVRGGLINSGLYDLMMDTLWAMFKDICRRWPVISWQVDGGIVRNDDAEEIIYHMASQWHIKMRTDGVGPASLIGPAWLVGSKTSNHYWNLYDRIQQGWEPPTTPWTRDRDELMAEQIESLRQLRHDWYHVKALAPMALT